MLATLLTEMDGIQGDDDRALSISGGDEQNGGGSHSGGVIVLGATNRLDFIDAALLRKVCFVVDCFDSIFVELILVSGSISPCVACAAA